MLNGTARFVLAIKSPFEPVPNLLWEDLGVLHKPPHCSLFIVL